MPAESLNHYTIRVRDLDQTKDFYCDIVGLTVGERPPLPFPGYWLYCGDIPTVHLISHRAEDPQIPDSATAPAATGRLVHIAFTCKGLNQMREHLRQRAIKFDERVLPRFNMTQLFYLDPDGISVECNFDAAETETTGMRGY